jgi:hypothetical protein
MGSACGIVIVVEDSVVRVVVVVVDVWCTDAAGGVLAPDGSRPATAKSLDRASSAVGPGPGMGLDPSGVALVMTDVEG